MGTSSSHKPEITVSVTKGIREYLEELTTSDLYGKNVAETANDLIKERIRELLKTGELERHEES